MIIVWAVVLLTVQATLPRQSGNAAPLSVCRVLDPDPTKLKGKLIVVRGLLEATDEGVWLVGECGTHLVTKGLVWGNDIAISIDEPDRNALQSWRRLREQMRRLHADAAKDRVWVTIVGRLETRQTMEDAVVQMPYGLRKAGFGHMGDSPAEIRVVSVQDISVERRPKGRK